MNIFISSLITGYGDFREAVATAVQNLGHGVLRAEDFPTSPGSAQQACLAAVREADVVVLVLGSNYGAIQDSGLSATHEEYREAREEKPVLVFVEAGVTPDPSQQAFIDEVQAWATGHVRTTFATPVELERRVTRSLHDLEVATSGGSLDEEEMLDRATRLLLQPRATVSSPRVVVAIAGGPRRQIIRPAEIEDPALAREVQQEAMFGDHAVFTPSSGTDVEIVGDSLLIGQSEASIAIDQLGSVRIGLAIGNDTTTGRFELPSLIEEDMVEAVARSIRFGGWILDHIDPIRRLTDVAISSCLTGSCHLPWRTREEHAASLTSGNMGFGEEETAVSLTPPRRNRQALTHDADQLAEDIVTLLRRGRTS